MSDPGFFDGLVVGGILLGALFGLVFIGVLLTPLWWLLVVLGWPLLAAIVLVYEVARGISRWTPRPGRGAPPLPAVRCGVCGSIVGGESQACPSCGAHLRTRFGWRRPPPTFCQRCGTPLEGASRYRRGFCPECREYR